MSEEKGKLTPVGCGLVLLTVAIIFGLAVPIVQWRNPATGRPLPRSVAIFSPVLIGAAFHAICSGLLRLVGIRTWIGAEKDDNPES
jgi:hypothetical protein